MKTYLVKVPFAGYSRGYRLYEVTTGDEDVVFDLCDDLTFQEEVIVRDDREEVMDEATFKVLEV